MSNAHLRFPVALSVLAAVVTIGLKGFAYLLTGSVGLLSDALESGINLLAAVTAYLSLLYSARPADRSHAYGHEKIEFFSSGLEGVLIIVAAAGIGWLAVGRLIDPRPLEALGVGTAVAVAASAVNFAVAMVLLRVGRRHGSIVLEADGQHLMADVWTSVGVVGGLAVVSATGWLWVDPALALAVAAHVGVTGVRLIKRSFNGLMDHSLPAEEVRALCGVIESRLPEGTAFHALRTRLAGSRRFADFHLLVPGDLTVRAGHDLAHRVEEAVRALWPDVQLTVHVEPIEERSSWEDAGTLPASPGPVTHVH